MIVKEHMFNLGETRYHLIVRISHKDCRKGIRITLGRNERVIVRYTRYFDGSDYLSIIDPETGYGIRDWAPFSIRQAKYIVLNYILNDQGN